MPGTWVKRTWQSNPWLDAPAKYRRACRYEAFVPDLLASLPLTISGPVAGVVADAEAFVRRLNHASGGTLAPLAHLLLRTESIASSKIEGLQVGARQLARAEAQRDIGEVASRTAMELLANIDAMELAVDEAAGAAPFTVRDLLAIHARLMRHAPHERHASIAGRLRTEQDWIGGNDYNPCGADFVPPPPEEIARLLDDLCAAVNDDLLPPLVQAALVHAQFETIHPFDDGNGRAGRALIHVVLRRRGVAPHFVPPVSVVFAAARDRYIKGLSAFRFDDPVKWVEQLAAATARAASLAESYVRAVDELRDTWRRQLREHAGAPRQGAAAWAIIDQLPAHPVLTAPNAERSTGRAKASIYPAIEQLVAAGVLSPLSESKRNRAWEAVGLLSLVEGLEEGVRPHRP